jgi:acetyl-CoA carboxylase biotin carboxyl carrier protein
MTIGDATRLFVPDQPLDPTETADLLKRLQDSALELLAGLNRPPSSLRVKADQVEIEMHWADQPAPAPAPSGTVPAAPAGPAPGAVVEAATDLYVTAHTVGVFYLAPEPGAKPFVEVGEVIAPGRQVGIIEAMKLMIPVEAEVAGRVVDVLASNGASVEYGDRLVAVEPVDG